MEILTTASGVRAAIQDIFRDLVDRLHAKVYWSQSFPAGIAVPADTTTHIQRVVGARASESDWRIAWWEDDEPAPRDAVNALEEETGDRRFGRFVGVHRRSDLHEGVATLDVKVQRLPSNRLRLSRFNWWFARHCSRTYDPTWREYPHIWFGASTLPETGPPFDARDPAFRFALTQVFNDVGMDALPVRPSQSFLKAIARSYDAASHGKQRLR
jgi:hypothetical protein